MLDLVLLERNPIHVLVPVLAFQGLLTHGLTKEESFITAASLLHPLLLCLTQQYLVLHIMLNELVDVLESLDAFLVASMEGNDLLGSHRDNMHLLIDDPPLVLAEVLHRFVLPIGDVCRVSLHHLPTLFIILVDHIN